MTNVLVKYNIRKVNGTAEVLYHSRIDVQFRRGNAAVAGMSTDCIGDIATFQMGTYPALTTSPIAHPLVNAAELTLSGVK